MQIHEHTGFRTHSQSCIGQLQIEELNEVVQLHEGVLTPTALPSKKDQSIQATSIENTIVSMQLKASVEVRELAMISGINLAFALNLRRM